MDFYNKIKDETDTCIVAASVGKIDRAVQIRDVILYDIISIRLEIVERISELYFMGFDASDIDTARDETVDKAIEIVKDVFNH